MGSRQHPGGQPQHRQLESHHQCEPLYSFTNWAANGVWAKQTFEFVTPKDLFYVSLALTGKNHIKASYAALDLD